MAIANGESPRGCALETFETRAPVICDPRRRRRRKATPSRARRWRWRRRCTGDTHAAFASLATGASSAREVATTAVARRTAFSPQRLTGGRLAPAGRSPGRGHDIEARALRRPDSPMSQLTAVRRIRSERRVGDQPLRRLAATADVHIVDPASEVCRNRDIIPNPGLVRKQDVAVVLRSVPGVDQAVFGEANQDRGV